MYTVKLLNSISQTGLSALGEDFTLVENASAQAIILRSADMHGYEFEAELLAVARAGAGYNNIPVERCSQAGIAVFNTPGANANGVKELAICALLLSSRRVCEGVAWCAGLPRDADIPALVEKGKKDFAGCEIAGKKLGVVGLGAVGGMVANAASALGMEVWGTDPFLSVDAAWSLSRSVKKAPDVDYLLRHCDYLSLHVPLNDSTRNMLDERAFCAMKPGMRIVNLSRGGLVDNAALLRAIEAGVVASYVTDFPEAELLGVKNVLTIPHLGASTAESEENCAVMAAGQVADYLRDGYIRNSVNLPEFQAPRAGLVRVAIVHRNTPNMLGQITAILAAQGINIEHLFNRSKKDYAYTVVDTNAAPAPGSLAQLRAITGVARVRVID